MALKIMQELNGSAWATEITLVQNIGRPNDVDCSWL